MKKKSFLLSWNQAFLQNINIIQKKERKIIKIPLNESNAVTKTRTKRMEKKKNKYADEIVTG